MTRKEQIWNEACHRYADSKMRNAFVAATEWADSRHNWIPVEKELPKEKGRLFLVCLKDGRVGESAYDVEDDIWYRQSGTVLHPTHWMQMPQPPRKEE